MRLLLLFLLSLPLLSYCQSRKDSVTAVPRSALRMSPFHLMNFYPTLQLGYENRIYNNLTLYLEGGYVLNYKNERNTSSSGTFEYKDKRGYKFKAEPRVYFYENRSRRVTFYLGMEFYVNRVNFDRSQLINECYDADCVHLFQRRYSYEVKYREFGFGPKYGIMIYMHDFFFDFNTGFVIRNIDYRKPVMPSDPLAGDDFSEWNFFPIEDKRTTIGPVLGIRFGYRIR